MNIHTITDVSMSPEQLYKAALAFERIDAPQVGLLTPASLQRVGELFHMFGPSGRHSLSVSATNAERLHAHWQGFKQTAAGRLPAPHVDMPEFWEQKAKAERAFALEDRTRRYGSVESIRIHEENAAEYEARAAKLRAAQQE